MDNEQYKERLDNLILERDRLYEGHYDKEVNLDSNSTMQLRDLADQAINLALTAYGAMNLSRTGHKGRNDCPYCHGHMLGITLPLINLQINNDQAYNPDSHVVIIDPKHQELHMQGWVDKFGEYSDYRKIHYCPVCGSDLKEE